MNKESNNVDKKCEFSFLVRSYDHLCTMNDKSKTTLVCGTDNCITSHCLWDLVSHLSCTPM